MKRGAENGGGDRTPAVVDSVQLSKEGRSKAGKGAAKDILKAGAKITGILLAILALATLAAAVKSCRSLSSPEDYADIGIYGFTPLSLSQTQEAYRIKLGGGWKDRTRTVYIVEYRTGDGVYRYRERTLSEDAGEKLIEQGQPIARRVLVNKETGEYLTIPPEETAESYLGGYRLRYLALIGASGVYLAAFCAYHLFAKKKLRKRLKSQDPLEM